MSTDVRVPTTGNAGEDAVISDWSVALGDRVSVGDVIVVLETAKASLDVESPVAGEVLKLLYAAGDEVPEHEVLAIIGEPGEVLGSGEDAPAGGVAAASDDMGATAPAYPSPGLAIHDEAIPVETGSRTGRISASPKARGIAAQRGIDLATISGTGPNGRIIIRDVPASASAGAAPAASALAAPAPAPVAAIPAPPTPVGDDFTVVPVRGARKITAQRMHASLQTTAQVTLTRYANADALLAYSKRLKTYTEQATLPRIGVNDLVLFALSRVLTRHPEANSWFDWDGITQFRSVNLGFAVDTGKALLVPVIRGAHALSLAQIASEARSAIDKARAGKLTTQEMDGGTFTVSNLGSLGVHWFTPVLNPPQSGILGVGAAHRSHPDGPALLPLSLTFDHRALDGASAAQLLTDIATTLESIDVLTAF